MIDCDTIDIPDPEAFDQCMVLEVDGERTYATMKEVVNDDVDKLFQGTLVGVEDSSILVDEGEEVDEVMKLGHSRPIFHVLQLVQILKLAFWHSCCELKVGSVLMTSDYVGHCQWAL